MKNINLSFSSSGLVCIKGKSGSGKSTLLNLIALIDKPTSGQILFNKQDISKYKEKEINYYHNQSVGLLFQHYNLIDDETVIYNIMLPCLIAGQKLKAAKKDAIDLLEKVNFPKDYYDKKVSLLSGGEKQRVALLRSLVNAPPILLCDEPTGALDTSNSIIVMNILKKVAHRRLVILVSHNDKLIEEYADRIITIKDGEIESDVTIIDEDNGKPIPDNKLYRKSNFCGRFAEKNIKKHCKRNIFSLLALSISLTSVFLSIGFSDHAQSSLLNASLNQFDLGVSTISKENKTLIPGSNLSMSQVSRITNDEIDEIRNEYQDFIISDDYSYFVPGNINVSCDDIDIQDIYYSPVYSFKESYINDGLIIKGKVPNQDTLKEVVINQLAYEKIKELTNDEPLYKIITLSFQTDTIFNDENGISIKDNFTYIMKTEIVGVVEEMSFLLTPKIYYSYKSLNDYLFTYPLTNLSIHLNSEYTVGDRVNKASNLDEVSSYDHLVFLKDVSNFESIKRCYDSFNGSYSFSNSAYAKYDTLVKFADVISLGLAIFIIIAIIGSVLILGIINFSSYSEDLKDSAILSSLGANKEDITSIFIKESLLVGIMSFLISFIFAFLFSKLGNYLIYTFTKFENMIVIPIKAFKSIPFALPILSFLGIVIIAVLSTYIPIIASKKISIKKELESND